MRFTGYVARGYIVGGADAPQPYTSLLTGLKGHDVVVGTAGTDYIVSTPAADVICGGAAVDHASGRGGATVSSAVSALMTWPDAAALYHQRATGR